MPVEVVEALSVMIRESALGVGEDLAIVTKIGVSLRAEG